MNRRRERRLGGGTWHDLETVGLSRRQRALRVYYQTPAWKERARRHRRRFPLCAACLRGPRGGVVLDVHHITYLRAGAGHELTRDLVTLCRVHHDQVHQLARGFPRMSLRAATYRVIRDFGNRFPRRSLAQLIRDALAPKNRTL